jgi:hypothetical protein
LDVKVVEGPLCLLPCFGIDNNQYRLIVLGKALRKNGPDPLKRATWDNIFAVSGLNAEIPRGVKACKPKNAWDCFAVLYPKGISFV